MVKIAGYNGYIGTDAVLEWMKDNEYGNYDFDSDESFKTNAEAIKTGSEQGKANFQRFIDSPDGLTDIENRFSELRNNYIEVETAVEQADSTEEIREIKEKEGIKVETLNNLKTQRGRLIRTQRTFDVRRQELADVTDLDTLYQKYKVSKKGTYKTLMRRFDVEEEYARERALELGLRG